MDAAQSIINELKELHDFLNSDKEIKLITGDGGVGKTRLAIEFANKTEEEKNDNWNVYFIHPYKDFNSGLIPDEKNTLLILDETSRYDLF